MAPPSQELEPPANPERFIAKAEGVAEVASVGGFVQRYSVVIDPRRLQALGIPLGKVREALRTSNMDVGGGPDARTCRDRVRGARPRLSLEIEK
jgi:Cu/Ag efflux pump CusA